MENAVIWDEVGIICGELGFKSKRELFQLKIGIVHNKEGWEDSYVVTQIKDSVLMKSKESKPTKIGAAAKVDYSELLDMDYSKPLQSWVYQSNYIMGINNLETFYIHNFYRGDIHVYPINFDPEIYDSVMNVVAMWKSDIEKAKEIQFKIKQLEKNSFANSFEITSLKIELEEFYNEGEPTDDYYRFLCKMRRVRPKNMQIPYIADDMEIEYIHKTIDLDEMIKYLQGIRLRTEYWIINRMRSKGAYVLGINRNGKDHGDGVYMIKDGSKMSIDFTKVRYRPDIRSMKMKIDEAIL